MKNNKNKKFFIIAIIVIVVILLAGFAFAFLATDMLKSNKDLFFDYASQIFDEDGFIDGKLEQYNEKKKNATYENEGTFTANVDSADLDSNQLKNINNFSISFVGNTDNLNNKAESLVKLNYTDDVNFPIYYKRVNGLHGIKMTEIAKGYFAIQEDEIGELIAKLSGGTNNTEYTTDELENGLSITSNITTFSPDLSSIKLTSEEKRQLKDNYLEVVKNSLDKSNFTKLETMDAEGYALEISNKELKDVLVKVLETLKNDNLMINKVSRIFGTEINAETIQPIIDNLNQMDISDGNTTITVYGTNKKLNKIDIQFNDEIKFTVSKKSENGEITYLLELEKGNDFFISFNAKFAGLQSLENITETYEISYDSNGSSYYYNIQNEVRFNDDINISDFKEKEYADLNKFNSEKLASLLTGLAKKIGDVNNGKMEEASLEGENPIISIIPGLSQALSSFNIEGEQEESNSEKNNTDNAENTSENTENRPENSNENNAQTTTESQESTSSTEPDTTGDMAAGMEQLTMQSFNQRIKQYEGQNVKGATVKSLMMQIIASNMAYEDRQIETTGDIVLTGDDVPDGIETSKYYIVKCYTGEDGYINKVEVKNK